MSATAANSQIASCSANVHRTLDHDDSKHRVSPNQPTACWDCMVSGTVNQGSMLNYAPSAAALPAPVGGEVAGHFSTLAAGFAVFQVFTVDYVEADVPRARAWNLASPAIPLIWPYRLRTAMSLGRPPAGRRADRRLSGRFFPEVHRAVSCTC